MTAAADVPAKGLTWYEATAVANRDRVPLTFDIDVDVCVVGGGLAGLTVAREIARRNWSVAVVEAQHIGWSASGRNCGFVLPGFAETMSQISERVGPEQARAMWALADAGRAYVRDAIRETTMPGVHPVDGWLRVAKFDEDPDLVANAGWLREQFAAEVEAWPADQVQAVLPSPVYCNAVYFPTAFHIHPLNYAFGLAAAAERAGARIFESTPALELDPAGVRKRVVTPSARVRAATIVLAGSVHLGSLQPRLAATLMPITTFVAVTASIGEHLREVVRYKGAVSDSERADNHYRIVGSDRLLWSGGMRTWPADPRRFASRLRADIRRTYPQLGQIQIEHVWSGMLGRTVHRMPQIGELAPGIWVASGFGGHGLNTTAMAGMLIARAIMDNDTEWRRFEPYELVWAGGRTGAAVLQAGYAGTRLRERVIALAARWRHRKRWPKAATPPVPPAADQAPDGAADESRGSGTAAAPGPSVAASSSEAVQSRRTTSPRRGRRAPAAASAAVPAPEAPSGNHSKRSSGESPVTERQQ